MFKAFLFTLMFNNVTSYNAPNFDDFSFVEQVDTSTKVEKLVCVFLFLVCFI